MEIVLRTQAGLAPPAWERAEAAARTLLTEAEAFDAEVSVLLTDDPGIRDLNARWRGINAPTDVLSWPQDTYAVPGTTADDSGRFRCLGDVAISLDTAARQAAVRAWSVGDEVALLLVHGILHLLGHEDDTEEGAEAMRAIEARLIGKPLEKVPVSVHIPS